MIIWVYIGTLTLYIPPIIFPLNPLGIKHVLVRHNFSPLYKFTPFLFLQGNFENQFFPRQV